MKKLFGLLIIGLLLSSTSSFAADNEIRFLPYYISPGIDDAWRYAFGLEAQYVIWSTTNLGVAIAGGVANWNASDATKGYEYTAYKLNGSATTFPLGASVLYRPTLGGLSEKIIFEGGLRYVYVSSDVDAKVQDDYSDVGSGSVDIGDGYIALIGADAVFPISPTMKLGFGAGYQFDISKGDTTFSGRDVSYENEMKGAFLRLDLDIKF